MINVDIRSLIEKDGKEISRYALVSGVAKRAQEISKDDSSENTKDIVVESAKDTKLPPVKKSVTEAVEELQKGLYEIVIPENLESGNSAASSKNSTEETEELY